MLQKLAALFKEFGFFAGLLYLSDRFLASISPSLRLYFYDIMVQPITTTWRRAHSHLGWKCVGLALFLQVGQLQFMAGAIFLFLHLSFGKSRSVQLKLRSDALLIQ